MGAGVRFGPRVAAPTAPPPISGGTLLIANDGVTAIAADPDRDLVWLVNLADSTANAVALESGDEPGRSILDDAGRVHVVLRRGGSVATIDVARQTLMGRRPVCAAPRGVDYDPARDELVVACQSGLLMRLAADAGPATVARRLPRDLRDVVVQGSVVFVSRFRAGEILRIEEDNVQVISLDPQPGQSPFKSAVAWRMLKDPAGQVAVLHQRANLLPIDLTNAESAYGTDESKNCLSALVHSTVTRLGDELSVPAPGLDNAVLAVDLALSAEGDVMAVAAPGEASKTPNRTPIFGRNPTGTPDCLSPIRFHRPVTGETTSVAFTPDGELVTQVRFPPMVTVGDKSISLVQPGQQAGPADLGHALFHRDAGGGIACASCHPEGADDGLTWTFNIIGPRRTQSMRMPLKGTEPLHWDGDMVTFNRLAAEVFAARMGGPVLVEEEVALFEGWVDKIVAYPKETPTDRAAVERGQRLFESTEVGCAGCHVAPLLTNNATSDVGTGGRFQVPSLIGIAARLPLMHDGCADTLLARFDPGCGGGDRHGRTSQLSEAQIADLVAYLETL